MNAPKRMLSGREAVIDRRAANPGFRCLTAMADRTVAGFTYGFHGENGQWWHDMVAGALAPSRPGRVRRDRARVRRGAAWLDDSFEIAELHVLPPYQGMGIGRSLLLSLTSGRQERTAVLSTADAPTRAQAAVPGGRVHRPADRVPVLGKRAALRGDGRPAAASRGERRGSARPSRS